MSEHEKLVTKSLMQLMRDCDAYFHNGEIVTRGALEISTWRECERRAKAVVADGAIPKADESRGA